MRKHIGTILEAAIRKSEYPISKIAKRIGYTRQHMYNLFNQAKVDLFLIEEIGKIINHDFSEDIVELKKYGKSNAVLYASVNEPLTYSNSDIERKYILLLEEYNNLLKEHNALLKTNSKKSS